MKDITLEQVALILAFLVSIIGSVEYLTIRLKKWLKKALYDEINPIFERLSVLERQNKEMELNTYKNFLVSFLSNVEQGIEIDEVESERFWETYGRYHELGGNSYIDNKVEKLRKAGKL